MHKIMMEEDYRPVRQPQRRLNPLMKEEVRKEVLKLLEAGLIYPISDSAWVSPVQVVPKKGGMTVAQNEKNDLIPTRTVTGWRMCIDYRKLNEAIRKDHLFSFALHGPDVGEACGTCLLLLLGWILWIKLDCSGPQGSGKDGLHMPFWCLCLQTDTV